MTSSHPNAELVGDAMRQIAASPKRQTVDRLAQRVEEGLPPELLTVAVKALGKIAKWKAVDARLELATHRRAAVRAQVATQLGRLKSSVARRTLLAMLDDPHGSVRAKAAIAVRKQGSRSAIPTLLEAARRGEAPAARAAAALMSSADVKRLAKGCR